MSQLPQRNGHREHLGMQRVSFHSFPYITTYIGKTWIAKIRRDPGPDFVINKNTKVCSLHFTSDDYISGDALHSASYVLKATAVPSLFLWTREVCQRKSKTSRLAASVHQRYDVEVTPVIFHITQKKTAWKLKEAVLTFQKCKERLMNYR